LPLALTLTLSQRERGIVGRERGVVGERVERSEGEGNCRGSVEGEGEG